MPLFYFQTFSKYLSYRRDNNELLFFLVKQLMRDQAMYMKSRYGTEQKILEVTEKEVAEKVCSVLSFRFVSSSSLTGGFNRNGH